MSSAIRPSSLISGEAELLTIIGRLPFASEEKGHIVEVPNRT
jgi:hypothetical protein